MASRARVRKIAARKANKYGIDRRVFDTQIHDESDFDDQAVSSAGAVGAGQLMPGTARSLGVRNSRDARQNLEGAAKYMRQLLNQFHGNYRKALAAYNAGPGNVGAGLGYADKILNGKAPADSGRGPTTKRIPGVNRSADRRKLIAQYLLDDVGSSPTVQADPVASLFDHDPIIQLGLGLRHLKDKPSRTVASGGDSSSAGHGSVSVAAGANRAGAGLSREIKDFDSDVAARTHRVLKVGTGTNHNRLTVNGNVSDHWDGHATDIPVPVDSRRGDIVASAALQSAGVPRARARAMAKRGGLYTINHNGKRIQVIWKTNAGGNHHNHVHIGVR